MLKLVKEAHLILWKHNQKLKMKIMKKKWEKLKINLKIL